MPPPRPGMPPPRSPLLTFGLDTSPREHSSPATRAPSSPTRELHPFARPASCIPLPAPRAASGCPPRVCEPAHHDGAHDGAPTAPATTAAAPSCAPSCGAAPRPLRGGAYPLPSPGHHCAGAPDPLPSPGPHHCARAPDPLPLPGPGSDIPTTAWRPHAGLSTSPRQFVAPSTGRRLALAAELRAGRLVVWISTTRRDGCCVTSSACSPEPNSGTAA